MEYPTPKDGGLQKIAAIGLFLLASSSFATVPTVRVMVVREKKSVKVEGFDLVVSDAATRKNLVRVDRKATFTIDCKTENKPRVKLGLFSSHEVKGALLVQSLGGFIRIGESQFRDELYVHAVKGECVVVNHVDLEKYIAGLLNSEMSANWNSQALRAQAVAARTYALFQMRALADSTRPYDLDSSVRDQVYEGAHKERYKALRAVLDTRGEILTYEGKPIKAFYHSTCGGRTERAEIVWGVRYPYLRPVECGFCTGSPRYNWVYDIPRGDLEKKLHDRGLLLGNLINLKVLDRNRLGRAHNLEVIGTGGKVQVSALRIRDLLGTTNIRSTDFHVASSSTSERLPSSAVTPTTMLAAVSKAANPSSKITFIGHGSGHGVGMCQYGAKAMGDKGYAYSRILGRYYPDAKLTKLY